MTAQIFEDTDRPDEDTVEVVDEAEPADGDDPSPAPWRRWGWLVLLVVAALLAGFGGWSLLRADQLRSSPAVANQALVDVGRTAEVTAQVSSALNRAFSYSYDRVEDTGRAADAVLGGEALDTYERLFARVRELAPKQEMVVTSRVISSAVRVLTDDSATLLVFMDQSATRGDEGTSDASAAQLLVTARLEGDRWVITELEPR